MRYNHRDFYVRGEKTQGDLRRAFVQAEGSLPPAAFAAVLASRQANDKSFHLYTTQVAGDEYILITTRHATYRALGRSCISGKQLRQRAVELCSNAFIGRRIIATPLGLADDGKSVEPTNLEGNGSTIVVDEVTGLLFIFEAGFSFIRLATVHNIRKDRPFVTYRGTCLLKVKMDGELENNPDNIPEVKITNMEMPF